jgi:hypothetical protein
MQPDPLGLREFTQYVFTSIDALWPVALGGLLLILLVYGARKAL